MDAGINKEIVFKDTPRIEAASTVMASPDHPSYTADKAVARTLAGGKSAMIAAIDGVGSGGEQSAKAAEVVQRNLSRLESSFVGAPRINQAVVELKNAIFAASQEIKQLKQSAGNPDLDTTVSAGVICESPDGKRKFLVTANVGDSRVYRYKPSAGQTEQLTKDNSLVQSLVDGGLITPDEAFTDERRNFILKSVGDLHAPKEIDFTVTEIHDGDILMATSDGVSDNLTPTGFPAAARTEFQAAFDGTKPDLKKFATGLAQRAQNVMKQGTAEWAKPDDASVAVLRIPRATANLEVPETASIQPQANKAEVEQKPAQEVIAEFKNYIYQGGLLIRDGKYGEAMEYFKNASELAKIGRRISPARSRIVNEPPRPEEYQQLADAVAKNSWNKEGGSIELSNIDYYTQGQDGRLQRQALPPELQREISLVYMEEWLHSLQDIQEKSLAGQADYEVDVAAYMEKNGIPMTDAFKRRYGRAEALAKAAQNRT